MFKCKKLGLTFVEVILVMTLISFLYIVTTKVIQHNLEQKVPLYVYNLYKNLDTEGKLLAKKLIDQANSTEGNGSSSSGSDEDSSGSGTSTGNKTIKEVLKGLDAKSYCETFAEDVNLIGNVDCENSSTEESIGEISTDQTVNFNCTRNESITFGYANNTYKINSTGSTNYDSSKEQCSQNKILEEGQVITCNAKPTQKVDDLLIDNTQSNYTYTCQKVAEIGASGSNSQEENVILNNYNVDEKIEIPNHLKTTNNIHLLFKTLYAKEMMKGQYNLKVNLNRAEICPTLNTLSTTLTANDSQCDISCTAKIDNSSTNTSLFKMSTCSASKSISGATVTCTPSVIAWVKKLASRGNNWIDALTNSQENSFRSKTASVTATTSITNNCNGYLTYAQNVINDIYNISSSASTKNVAAGKGGSCDDHASSICSPHTRNVYMSLKAKIVLSNTTKAPYIQYYNTWYNFFNDYSSLFPTKQKIEAISNKEYGEGSIFGTENLSSGTEDGKQYLAHFIYASIDTPFDKGEMNKNIFVFEQFGNKIIPVGYLANNANTPLKFDVITRNPQTFKIEKINNSPLTFCQAMEYTGDKFSQYCGCKDENNNLVTQFNKIEACNNNFGCMIKPIQPANLAPKFKLF